MRRPTVARAAGWRTCTVFAMPWRRSARPAGRSGRFWRTRSAPSPQPAGSRKSPAAARLRAAVLIGLPRDIGYLFESFTLVLDLRRDVIERVRERFRARYGSYPEDYSAPVLARRIHIPVLLVHGGADEYIPAAHAHEVALQLRDGHIEVIEGMSHSAPLRDPATVELMAQFISATAEALSARSATPPAAQRVSFAAPAAARLSLLLHRQCQRDDGRQLRTRHQLLGDVPAVPLRRARLASR